jgi:multiple sugar transport system permease protein
MTTEPPMTDLPVGQAAAIVRPAPGGSDAPASPVGGRHWRRRLAYALLIGYGLLMFVPFAWTVITSFKTLPDSTTLSIIPQPITTAGWSYVFTNLRPTIPVLFGNSLLIAGVVTLTNLVLGSIAGYAFARLRFPGREALFLIVLATLMIPDQLRLPPIYVLFSSFGFTKGAAAYLPVILIAAISASSIFLLRQYFLTIPREIEEAARIDGAGFGTTFLRVMLPLATPALSAVTILQFQGTWNSLFWPAVFLSADSSHWTLPLGLALFRGTGGFGSNWPPLMATVVIATIPILVLYLFFQRYFVEGIAASAVKG